MVRCLIGNIGENMQNTIKNAFYSLIICTILVAISYWYIDKPVAYWVYDHLMRFSFFSYLTYIAVAFYVASPLYLLIFVVRWAYKKAKYWEWVGMQMAISVIITTFYKDILKNVFGRTWPETWIHNNPSLISNHVYGFHFFHSGIAYHSFPSGHASVTFAVTALLWIKYPKLRWLAALLSVLVVVGLLGMNYHFVSDVIAGAFLGSLVAYFVSKVGDSQTFGPPHELSSYRSHYSI